MGWGPLHSVCVTVFDLDLRPGSHRMPLHERPCRMPPSPPNTPFHKHVPFVQYALTGALVPDMLPAP